MHISIFNELECKIIITNNDKPTELNYSSTTNLTQQKEIKTYDDLMNRLNWLLTSEIYYKKRDFLIVYYLNYYTKETKEDFEKQHKQKYKTHRVSKKVLVYDCNLKKWCDEENILVEVHLNYKKNDESDV